MSLADELGKAQTAEQLRAVNARLARQLEAQKFRTDELVRAIHRAATDALAGLTIPPIPKPKPDKRTRGAETAVAVLADWQLGKRTPTYSSEVCEERIERYADKVIELAEIQRRDHPVRECRVYLLGDLVEGELIFPGQAHHIDASLYRQVTVDGPRILGNFIRRMAATFDKVHVSGVIGNHGALGGRARKEYHPESNADAMMYEITRLLTEGERVTWAANVTEGQSHWYAIDQIGEHRFFLFHGNQVRGYNGFPWYGMGKKAQGWFASFQNIWRQEGFRYALHGHFHTPNRMYLNGLTIWGSGSTESHNPYALEELAAAGEPCQWLLFAHPKRGVTAEYLVDLT